MNELSRLRSGMGVADVSSRLVGRVDTVGSDSFAMHTAQGTIELRAEVLFHVGQFTASLVCDGHEMDRYRV
ncbi:MAG: hypothetical protein ABI577_03285 [bacterium]